MNQELNRDDLGESGSSKHTVVTTNRALISNVTSGLITSWTSEAGWLEIAFSVHWGHVGTLANVS